MNYLQILPNTIAISLYRLYNETRQTRGAGEPAACRETKEETRLGQHQEVLNGNGKKIPAGL